MSASASSSSAAAAAASSAARRQSMMPSSGTAGPKAPAHFASNITVADSSILVGSYPITISSESVIHPRARLDSASGPVNIGRRCIVHERSHVGATPAPGGAEGSVTLADFVTAEVGAVVETGGTFVGEGTVLGVKSRVGRGASIGRHCTLAPQTVIAPGEKIPDFTVIYSNGLRRQDKRGVSELRGKAQARQIEVLRRLIPSNPARFA